MNYYIEYQQQQKNNIDTRIDWTICGHQQQSRAFTAAYKSTTHFQSSQLDRAHRDLRIEWLIAKAAIVCEVICNMLINELRCSVRDACSSKIRSFMRQSHDDDGCSIDSTRDVRTCVCASDYECAIVMFIAIDVCRRSHLFVMLDCCCYLLFYIVHLSSISFIIRTSLR